MKRLLLGLIVLMSLLAAPAHAQDSAAAIESYTRGDYAEALRVWRPLAERGDGDAQASLGLLYARSQGVRQDYAEALKWFRQSAAQGYAIGQNNLGVMYRNGYGVRQDYAMAATFYRLSAAQGYALAQSSLAAMYENGDGVRRDYEEAYMWYTLAASQGLEGAEQSRQSLAQLMSDEQIRNAQARTQERQARKTAQTAPGLSKPADTAPPREIAATTQASPPEVVPAKPPPPIVNDAAWRVQLIALRKLEDAESVWPQLQRANQDLLDGLELHVQLAELSKGTFYRVQAGPLADRATAVSLCTTLKTRHQDCLIVAPKAGVMSDAGRGAGL
jgi:cell division septation protein DedD